MPKSLEENFADWENSVFGYGYGSGETHTIAALKAFLGAIPAEGPYDYRALESVCGPAVAWLLINTLAHDAMIEYGTSPRFGWLTETGKALREFVGAHDLDGLVEFATTNERPCYPDTCNCSPSAYDSGAECQNPFWRPVKKVSQTKP